MILGFCLNKSLRRTCFVEAFNFEGVNQVSFAHPDDSCHGCQLRGTLRIRARTTRKCLVWVRTPAKKLGPTAAMEGPSIVESVSWNPL